MINFIKKREKYLLFFILSGIILRLIWPMDMEWKYDEVWVFEHGLELYKTGAFPSLGMESGGNVKNPAFGIWFFNLIGFFTQTPLGFLSWIQWINIFSLIGFLFVLYKKSSDKINTLLAMALISVSPLPILFSRKIWAQNVLPLFTLIILITFLYRRKYLGAFLWGLVGGLIGQVHMSGFFFSLGIVIFVFLKEYMNKDYVTKWGSWLVGSALSLIPMISWFQYLLSKDPSNSEGSIISVANIFKFRFLTYNFMDVTGINLKYSLGKHFYEFVKIPYNLILFSICVFVLVFLTVTVVLKAKNFILNFKNIIKNSDDITLYAIGVIVGYGVILTFTGIKIRPHYLIICYPFSFYFFVKILENKKEIILISIVTQLFLSLSFLHFIHSKQDLSLGDYGKTYRLQMQRK
mgnify:CR=1 FL=1